MDIYSLFKKAAFKLDPESVHNLTLTLGEYAPQIADLFTKDSLCSKYTLTQNDLSWQFPVGIAAGLDKNAQCLKLFQKLGFGALEVGTVTKEPQKGNPRPRIFRHPEINSIQNAMGFPNKGSQSLKKNLTPFSPDKNFCVGVNIGKNKETTEERTPQEYAYLYKMFAPLANYIVVNISSPNTPGLRSFQKKELLTPIIEAISEQRKTLSKPVFIKIAPDLEESDLKMICELSKEFSFSGIIATNTTIQHKFGPGGLSGDYIRPYAKKIRNKACEFLKEDPSQSIIGVGAMDNYSDIQEFWKNGGSFVQVYTGLIYKGPTLLKSIKDDIDADLYEKQLNTVNELHAFYKNKY